MVLTLYVDGFQRMGDPQQQSVRVEGQIQRHVPSYGRLGCGQEEVDGGLSGEPGASLKHRVGQLSILATHQTHKCAVMFFRAFTPCCDHGAFTQMALGTKRE